jgi:hypothetical protein
MVIEEVEKLNGKEKNIHYLFIVYIIAFYV